MKRQYEETMKEKSIGPETKDWIEQSATHEVYDVCGHEVVISWGWAICPELGHSNEFDTNFLVELDGQNYCGFDIAAFGEAWSTDEYILEYLENRDRILNEIEANL